MAKDWKNYFKQGLSVVAIITGIYLAVSLFQNNNLWNMWLGILLGIAGIVTLFMDWSAGKTWKNRLSMSLAIASVLTAFYLVFTWIPHNNGANIALGWILLVGGIIVFIVEGFK